MTSFSDSEFYCESNGGTPVTRRLPVPEISRVGFCDKKGCGRQFSMTSFSDSEFYLLNKLCILKEIVLLMRSRCFTLRFNNLLRRYIRKLFVLMRATTSLNIF
jgi:hypothetical protein